MSSSNVKNFYDSFAALFPSVLSCIADITDDRRKWVFGQVGNTLLYRAATSMLWYLGNPGSRPSSLNEAITLRNAAQDCFEDEEAYNENVARIIASFEPSPVVSSEEAKEKIETPAFVLENDADIRSAEEDEEAMREKNLPLVRGFLDGAKYDLIDLPPMEWEGDRAHLAVTKAFEAIEGRVHQDIIHCGKKWKAASKVGNQKQMDYWNSEGTIAQMDLEAVRAVREQGGFIDAS